MKLRLSLNIIILLWFYLSTTTYAQTLTGHFPAYANEEITLTGFSGFNTYTIVKTKVDAQGRFTLAYNPIDRGMGTLMDANQNSYFVVLSGENINLNGRIFTDPSSVECTAGTEQQAFMLYASEQPRREQALSAWGYLEGMYRNDALFIHGSEARKAITAETARIKAEEQAYISNLDPGSYVRWYLPMRKLVSTVSTIAQYRTDEIPATIAAFRKTDYSDSRLYKSGLLKDAIDSQYWLLENMGKSLDSVTIEMNTSTDFLLASLEKDKLKFNEITDYLFNLLEQHSLFGASEYLALKALDQSSCTLDDDLAKRLESYRAMKKGNTAPNIIFSGELLRSGSKMDNPAKLSDIDASYKLIVFGASWCPQCTEEIPQITALYSKWKQYGVEVVFISLDTSPADFQSFTKGFPFLSYCDYKKWDSPAVTDYYVFATPTIFLLDQEQKIILRPNSVKQVDSWVDWYLAKK